MKKPTPEILDKIVDRVLAYRPRPVKKPKPKKPRKVKR